MHTTCCAARAMVSIFLFTLNQSCFKSMNLPHNIRERASECRQCSSRCARESPVQFLSLCMTKCRCMRCSVYISINCILILSVAAATATISRSLTSCNHFVTRMKKRGARDGGEREKADRRRCKWLVGNTCTHIWLYSASARTVCTLVAVVVSAKRERMIKCDAVCFLALAPRGKKEFERPVCSSSGTRRMRRKCG